MTASLASFRFLSSRRVSLFDVIPQRQAKMVMPAVSRVYQLSKYAFPLLLLTWYVVFVVDPGSAFRTEWRELQDRKMVFTDDLLEHDIDGPFNGSGIAELCASKKWHRNLVVSCDPPVGGLGRVKNCHLNCLRFAVEMGGGLPVLVSSVHQY